MFNRFRSAVIGAVSSLEANGSAIEGTQYNKTTLAPKFPYGRPHFLGLGDDEVQMSADHKLRPVIHPSKPLPHETGKIIFWIHLIILRAFILTLN